MACPQSECLACHQGRGCKNRKPLDPVASLRSLWLHAKRAYLKWALREMSLLHPDLPHVVHELRNVEAELRGRS
jgi:hypothetical protein